MRSAKQFIVGGRGDALAAAYRGQTLAALREAHPQAVFIDGGERERCRAKAKDDTARAGVTLLQRLAKRECDIAIVDARALAGHAPAGISIAAVLDRSNPYDVFISSGDTILDELPENSCIAASDIVRRGQLVYYRSDLKIVDEGREFDALLAAMGCGTIRGFVFAAADVEALHQQDKVVEVFTTSICTPAAGQGALALAVRREDREALAICRALADPASAAEIELERMFLERIARDGRAPVGVLANVEEGSFELEAAIVAPDGSEKIAGSIDGRIADAARVIDKLARELIATGGEEILAVFRKAREHV